MRRSSVLLAAAFVPALPVLAQAPVRIRVASSPNDDLIAVLWGLESGAFRAAGLDVDLQKANSGAAVAAAVAGGAVDVGKSSILSIITARARQIPFVLVAPCGLYNADAPTIGMIVARDAPVKTGRDLNGKIVAVSALNDLFSLGSQTWVDANGGDAKTLHFVEMPAPAMAEAVIAGRVDAGTLAEPTLGQATKDGRTRILCAPDSAIARRFMQAAYFADSDYAARNKAAIAAFRRVIETAGRYANEHRDQMVPVISRFTGVAESVVAAGTPQYVATSLDLRLVEPVVKVATAYHVIPAGFDTRALIDR